MSLDKGAKFPPPPFVRSLEHLVDFVDTASLGLHWVGADGTILWANPADYQALGYIADEYVGHNIAEFHVDPEVIADILNRLGAGERLCNYGARLRCKNGSVRHVEITSSVLFEDTPDGPRFVHTRCYTQDVTERKRMEQARDRFVSILGHDLRNPLSTVAMASERLLGAPDLPDRYRPVVERIASSASRMSRMIVDLIEFARTLGKQLPLERRPVDFAEVCRRIIDEVCQASPATPIALHVEGRVHGSWDPDRLAQAVSNLLTNAVQHGQLPITAKIQDDGDHVLFEVSNAGPAIEPDALASVFEPFSPSTSTSGLGLGLFIVSEIVNAHGGTITVRSTERGTTFSSRWPKAGTV
jgi:PAS domain S-box-containing protein